MCKHFNAEEYWSRPGVVPSWTIRLSSIVRRKVVDSETRYVRAKTKTVAARAAIENTFMMKPVISSIRLSTPEDLGATCFHCKNEFQNNEDKP